MIGIDVDAVSEDNFDNDIEGDDDLDCPIMRLSKDEKVQLKQPWRNALIMKVLGRTSGFAYLSKRLNQLWGLPNPFELIDLANGYFLIWFACKSDFDHVLNGGPWLVSGHMLH